MLEDVLCSEDKRRDVRRLLMEMHFRAHAGNELQNN
jgi:hypothetical protein